MHCRFFLFLCIFLQATLGLAETGAPSWVCEQSTEDQQWRCETSIKPESKPTESGPEVQAEQTDQEPVIDFDLNAPLTPLKSKMDAVAPPKTLAKRPGWNCKANPDNDTWDCNLVGRDPKGQTRLMAGEESVIRNWFGVAYDPLQEQIFRTLQDELQYDPWAACTGSGKFRPADLPGTDARETTPMEVGSDYSEVFDKEITSFYGNVDLRRSDQHVMSDRATYDSVADTMDVQGNVYYSENELSLFSHTGFMDLNADKTKLRDVLFISPGAPLRGSADVVYRDSSTFSYYKTATFTSCQPGNQDWVMHADRLKMNTKTGKGAAKHAWLEFKGIPFLYTPYISFPLDDRRLSGFLTPTWGSTNRSGFDINVPYYWNIAPNYDALFWGRYLGKRGPVLGSQFRYLTEMFRGSVEFEILPSDDAAGESRGIETDANGATVATLPVTKSFRGAARFRNSATFTPTVRSEIDLNYVSDPYYFDDLGNSLHIATNTFLRSYADLTYKEIFGDEDEDQTSVSLLTQVDNYQSIDVTQTSRPYQRLPQVLLNLHRDSENLPLELDMDTEFVYFEKKNKNNFFGLDLDDFPTTRFVSGVPVAPVTPVTPVTGSRFNIHPSVSFPLETASAFITPKAGLQYTQYWLKDQEPGRSSNISRTLPIFSLDSGLFFEREFGEGDSSLLHTIEPRLFYVYIPHTNQDDIPLFDTGEFDFTSSQLFRENRFTGSDRVGDANQLTYALTSRLLSSADGDELLNFTIGQIYYFQDRRVNLNENDFIETNSLSNVIVGLNGRISDHITFSSGTQWNPDSSDFDRFQASIRYRGPAKQLLNLGYRFRRDEFLLDSMGQVIVNPVTGLNTFRREGINQSDISFLWPLYDGWSIVGRWQYSFDDEVTLDSFLGVELDSCCWRFRIIGRRFVTNIDNNTGFDNNTGEREIEPDNAIFFQFELKGLSSFGEDVEEFLERQINGYRRP